jgi:hypothetical protein
VNPLLADPPAPTSPDSEQPPAGTPPQAAGETAASANGALKLAPQAKRSCRSCGASLAEGQEWCLQCGAGAAGSIVKETDWRPLAVLAAAGAILLAGAATAAYAALNQQPTKPPTHLVIAQVAPPAATTPPTASTPSTTPVTPTPTTPGAATGGAFGKTPGSTSGLSSSTIKPLKLPAVVPTPHASLPTTSTPTPSTGSTPTSTPAPSATTPTNSSATTQPQTPNPILLDTDAASTYNPSNYPASYFGDPSLAIDGETTTAWTAQVEPNAAPRMAAGLALDLKAPTRVGSLEVQTSTPGVTVEIYGANGSTLPTTITDPGWTKLKAAHLIKKKTATIKLGSSGKAFRFLVLWLVQAPAASIGTPTAPGHVSFSELVLYPPAK